MSDFKSGYVAIVGQPNVGKSTLLNQLLDVKLSIVTPRPQTTRHQVLGIKNSARGQIVFLDTPGIIQPKYELHEAMMRSVSYSIESADLILTLSDVTSQSDREFVEELAMKQLAETKAIKILALNKIDLVNKNHVLPLIDEYDQLKVFSEIVPLSALQKDGVMELEQIVLQNLPSGPPFYPTDVLTEQPERFFVAELIREQIFLQYREEIPYAAEVSIEEFREKERGKDYIRATIFVERESQKAILVGKKGAKLKKVGEHARTRIEEFLGRPVFLELWVRVREKWRREAKWLKEFGYR